MREIRPHVLNTNTGNIIIIDPYQARLGRLRRRVHSWTGTLAGDITSEFDARLVMITLTYRPTQDGSRAWEPGHIRDFMKTVRRNTKDGLLAYAWVAELQSRGEVHYHVLLSIKRGTWLPKPDKAGWWAHGSTRVELAKHQYYILKYVQKQRFKDNTGTWQDFPKGMRLFAVWLAPDVVSDWERFDFRLSAVPHWLADDLRESGVIVKFSRTRGGGWTITGDNGDVYHKNSPYRVVSIYEEDGIPIPLALS